MKKTKILSSKITPVALSIMLVMTMVISCIPFAGAQIVVFGDYSYRELGNGEAEITRYHCNIDDDGGEPKYLNVEIPSQIDGFTVTKIGGSADGGAFEDLWAIKSVTIPDTVKSIGEKAFRNCTSLESVSIPESVTSIAAQAFSDCEMLKNITLPENLTDADKSAFTGTAIFENPDNRENGVLYIGSHLVAVDSETVGDCNIKQGTKVILKSAFESCRGLTSITIPDSVTYICNEAFVDCAALKDITIPDSVTYIGESAFSMCDSLSSVVLPNGITSVEKYLFNSCNLLTSVTIPNSVKTINEGAFWFCSSLKSLNIPAKTTSIDVMAFNGCKALSKLSVDNKNPIYSSKDNVLYNKNKTILYRCFGGVEAKNLSVPNGVKTISEYAFQSCTAVKGVTLPDSVTTIGIGAFDSCYSLESIKLPSKIKFIDERVFAGCISFKSVTIPNGVTVIGDSAFLDCTALKNISLPTSLKSIKKSAFFSCAFESLYIPDSVTSIEAGAFTKCSSLKSIKLSNKITKIEDNLFSYSGLVSITIPEGVTSIGSLAFASCTELTSVSLPETLKTIGQYAFVNCRALKKIYVPSSVTKIGSVKSTDSNKKDGNQFAFKLCPSDMTMYGKNDSFAQKYAKANDIKFSTEQFSVTVVPTKITVNKTTLTLGLGETYTITVTPTPSDAVSKYTWSSSNKNVVTVNNGKLTAGKAGSATITVKSTNGKTATCKVTVKPAATKVYLNKSSLTLGIGETFQLTSWCADGTYSAKRGFGSSNNSVVYTNGNGKLTAKKAGTATITVKTFNGKTATCKVTVKPAATKVYLNKSSLTLGIGETFQLTSWCENGTYSAKRGFGSSSNDIVYTSGNGKLTAKKVGTATITVKTFNGKTATCKVTVKPAATKVYLNKSSLTLKVGETFQLTSWCENGTYSAKRGFGSSNNSIVYTSGNGKLTAKKAGTATITVKTFNGKTATCKVTVK